MSQEREINPPLRKEAPRTGDNPSRPVLVLVSVLVIVVVLYLLFGRR